MRPKKKKRKHVRKKKTLLVVGNLPDTCTDDDLHTLFSNFGQVTDCDVINKCGFVRMKTLAEAQAAQDAVKKLNNPKFDGFSLSVEIAKSNQVIGTKPTTKAAPAVLSSSLEKFAFHKLVMHLVSQPNIGTILSVTPDYCDYEKEFERFLLFIERLEGPGKLELSRAIFPLFVNFYLNMIDNRRNAVSFYCKFAGIFHSSQGYEDVLEELYAIRTRTELNEHAYFKNFRARKYVLRLSSAALKLLNSFLKDTKSIALWQTLSLFFYFEDSDVESLSDIIPKKKAKKPKQLNKIPCNQNPFSTKKNTIEKKKLPAGLNLSVLNPESSTNLINVEEFDPPILRIGQFPVKSDIFSMDFNQDVTELCIAFGDSSISVTSLGERHISKKVQKLQEKLEKFFPDSDEDDDSDEEEEMSWKKIFFSAPARAVKYFPNQPYLLLVACGTEITKVNTASDTVTSFGSGHIGEIWDIDINSTGSLFCTASQDTSCRLWSINKSSVARIFAGHEQTVRTVKFHPNGIYLLSGSMNHDVRVWNIENGLCLRRFVDHKAPVTLLACSPDKKTLASADSNGVVKLYDIQEDNLLFDIQCYKENKYDGSKITSMCYSDENFLGLSNSKGEIRIWDVRQPSIVYKKSYSSHIPMLLKASYLKTWTVILREKGDG